MSSVEKGESISPWDCANSKVREQSGRSEGHVDGVARGFTPQQQSPDWTTGPSTL